LLDLSSTDDFRLFCGDLGNEVNDDVLAKAFSKFPSFNMARVSLNFSIQLHCSYFLLFLAVLIFYFLLSECWSLLYQVIRDKWTGKTKGYGFVSFANASDLTSALKEMNGMNTRSFDASFGYQRYSNLQN